jgi:phosphoglycerate kinase
VRDTLHSHGSCFSLAALGGALQAPQRPFAAVIGGAKVSSKNGVLSHLLDKVDVLIVGGGMANTFFKAQRYDVGQSLLESDYVATARQLLDQAGATGGTILLPVDVVVTTAPLPPAGSAADVAYHVADLKDVAAGDVIVDIGPRTRDLFGAELLGCRTILWNGPMGIFEMEPFAAGTRAIADMLAKCTRRGATTVVGGGDSVVALESMGLADQVSHVSTGGGASLEFLEGKTLPGVAVLADR